ncbi:MAG: CRISPR system precrRNA processing endoribonuclease RAMP protein Cas6 [Sulfolobales archaeon]
MVGNAVKAHLIKAVVKVSSDWNAPLFTGKLVKSLLIDVDPNLKEVFKKIQGVEPKLIHITPLYESSKGKIRCIYSSAEVDERGRLRRVSNVRVNGIYEFYIGFIERFNTNDILKFDRIYSTLLDVSGVYEYSKHKFIIELTTLRTFDVEEIASRSLSMLFKNGVLRMIFSSPTMLRDPFRSHKYKSLVPLPLNVFSTPLYIYLILTGKMNQKHYMKTLIAIHRILNETHAIISKDEFEATVKVRHIYYEEGKILPTITGYVNYRLNMDVFEKYRKVYDIEMLLHTLMKLIITIGTGTSRASGFGHILLSTPQSIQNKNSSRSCGVSGGDLI